MARITAWLLFLFAFAVPWEYSLDFGEPVGNVARVLSVALLAVMILAVLLRGGMKRLGVALWLVLALYLYFAASYFWTVDAAASLEKMRAYLQVMAATWLVWEIAETPEDLRRVLRALVAGCGVLAALTVMNFASTSVLGQMATQARFAAAGQDPNDVARFLDFGFPAGMLLFATEERWRWRLVGLAYLPLGLMAVLLTASRGGFVGAMVAMLGSAMLLVMWRPKGASLVFVGLTLTAAVLWLFVPMAAFERLATIPTQLQTGDLNERVGLWVAGWRAFTHAPWFGHGAGSFATAAGLGQADTAHNTLIAVLVTGGVVGGLLFTSIVVAVGWCVGRTRGLMRVALATTLAVWVVTSMVGSVEENRMTWLLFGIMALAGRLADEAGGGMERIF
ncbi:MAG TPA: O-antigen ligase family protein, partial [Acidobacteriaceae bacterium]|nr:O-antigen ligase family protein [Acidobacteriaceae bacterium]